MDLLGLGAAVAPGLTKIVGDVLNRLLPAEKMSEAEKLRLQSEIQLAVLSADFRDAEMELRDRADARALAAAESARGNAFTTILSATDRPTWSFGCLALMVYMVVAPSVGMPKVDVPEQIWNLMATVVFARFGGRTVEKGIAMWKGKK